MTTLNLKIMPKSYCDFYPELDDNRAVNNHVIWEGTDLEDSDSDDANHYRIIQFIDCEFASSNECHDMLDNRFDGDLAAYNDYLDEIRLNGVYVIYLQIWNPDVGCGWEIIDSIPNVLHAEIAQKIQDEFVYKHALNDY